MQRKLTLMILAFFLALGMTSLSFAAKVPAPAQGGEGFKAISLEEAKKLYDDGAQMIACHSHTTDFMSRHPLGTIHTTCMVPKKHKYVDFPLDQVVYNLALLPKDKSAPIITYCFSNN